jgi:hypothetical protein
MHQSLQTNASLNRRHQLAFYVWHGFRYSLDPSFPHENCHLSERLYYDLDPYNDILPDRNYDIYSKNEYAQSCQEKFPQRHPFAESGMYAANHSSSSSWDVLSYSVIVNHFRLFHFICFLSYIS